MFKRPDASFFYLVYQANLIMLSTPLDKKTKEHFSFVETQFKVMGMEQ